MILADALDPEKKGVGAAQGSCLGDYLANFIEKCLGVDETGMDHHELMERNDRTLSWQIDGRERLQSIS